MDIEPKNRNLPRPDPRQRSGMQGLQYVGGQGHRLEGLRCQARAGQGGCFAAALHGVAPDEEAAQAKLARELDAYAIKLTAGHPSPPK